MKKSFLVEFDKGGKISSFSVVNPDLGGCGYYCLYKISLSTQSD